MNEQPNPKPTPWPFIQSLRRLALITARLEAMRLDPEWIARTEELQGDSEQPKVA